ncbi:hypothetical protein QZH41_008799 [Actinostola sp. cb2023]|nr:hypothetical protein QZH41_008799 [Actinostola sp. cb2023]
MAQTRTRTEELNYLKRLIAEWNASRLDIFAISDPNEDLEYRGVMRFFFQDSGSKVATKCVRFTSKDNTEEVTKMLVEKFHPDMKMLSNPTYSLYEVHPNGDARKLRMDEHPLHIQLEWQNNDREGRFLLKSDSDKIVHANIFDNKVEKAGDGQNFKRRLSKREKKQLKKKREEEAKKAAANEKAGKDGSAIAQNLYDELPETSFTRSISNPEAVMRRRRQQKLEKRLKDFQSKDSPAGGTLKIFATTLKPEIPYKTLLVSVDDSTTYVIKEALIKYQMEIEDPEEYCLIMVNIPPEGANSSATLGKERVVHDEDCPLKIAVTWPPSRGTVVFHLRRRANLPQHRREKRRSKSPVRKPMDVSPEKDVGKRLSQPSLPEHLLPYLLEIPSDGTDMNYKPRIHRLQMNVTEVGSEKSMSAGANYLQLHAAHILQRHCVITNMDGRVSVTPSSGDAEVSVNGKRFYETTTLRHDDVVKIGRLDTFKFCDPAFEKPTRHSAPAYDGSSLSSNSDLEAPRRPRPSSLGAPLQSYHNNHPSSHMDDGIDVDTKTAGVLETTFDVTGDVTTYTGGHREPEPYSRQPRTPTQTSFIHEDLYDDKLPATLEFLETGEDAFFAAVVSEVNGQAVHFKLAPTYTLYMCSRYRMSPAYRTELMDHQRGERLGVTLLKIANMARSTIRENAEVPGSLAFWMANCSELLHFIKQDRDMSPYTKDGQPNGQQVLAQSVHQAFRDFVRCVQNELRTVMAAFIDPTDGADMEDSDLDSLNENDNDHISEHSDGRSYRYGPDGRPLSSGDSWFGGRRGQGRATVSEVIYNLSSTMSLLRRCRVNAALTIQVFSQLFHFVNTWLFNKLVLEPKLGLCTKDWGRRISKRLARVEKWAEKQGLELAADCHLCRIAQAAHLLQAPKNSSADINAISSSCFKLNSLQVRTLLNNYRPGSDEYIPQELVESMVIAAEQNADEVSRSNGQELQLEEDWELQLPFLLPEDGYSCEVIRGVPPGLKGFLEPLAATGLCRLTIQPETSGLWTVYLKKYEKMSLDLSNSQSPEIQVIAFDKGRGGMGLSIVAAKGTRQDQLGIYIKQVVKDGPASQDGRLQAGDQILSVNGESLVGVTQERAAEVMVKSGANVSLRILKQGAIYHGLATLLIQSPTKDQPQRLTPFEPETDLVQSSPTLPDDNIPSSQYLQERRYDNTMQDERLVDDQRKSEVEERLREEQNLRQDEEERIRMEERVREEERIREEEKRREEEELLREEERRREEEERMIEEERLRQEEEDRLYEERRRREEEERVREEEMRRLEEQRQREAERTRLQKLEEERRRREAEEDEKFRIQEDRIRKRMEEERKIIEEERRKLAEERRLLEEERKIEEERKRTEQLRLQDEQRKLAEEKQRLEEERRLVDSRQMMELEERRMAEEDRRRVEEERAEEERDLAEEQLRREEIRMREEIRRREDQRRLAEERRRAEEEERLQANDPQPRRVRKIRFEDEVIAPANAPKVETELPVQQETFQKPAESNTKQDEVVEEEPVVVRGRLTEADMVSMDAMFEKLDEDVPPSKPNSLVLGNRPIIREEQAKDEAPKSPIRVDTRSTRYGRAIVIKQGMLPAARSPSSPNQPSKPGYEFDQVAQNLKAYDQNREQQKLQEYNKDDEFERWQRQQREVAEQREREAEEREQQAKEERQREDRDRREREQHEREDREREREERERQQREREEREHQQRDREDRDRQQSEREERDRQQREREERDRQQREREERDRLEREERDRLESEERERLEREERDRLERERQEQEQKRVERDRRDQERRERMQRSRIERERREREEKERQERLEKERMEREKQEMERKKKEEEEREKREKAEQQRQLEQQREHQALEEKSKQQEHHRQRLDAEQERLRIIERERKMLYPDDQAGNKTLDYIESMSADEVEREFQRRLEVENKRRHFDDDYQDRRAGGLVSVTRVTYHPDRNDQMERDRKLQVILQEQRMLDRERNRRNVYEGERDQNREVQRKLQEEREREQEDWLRNQKEKHEQTRREQGRVLFDKRTQEDEDVFKKRGEVQQKREQEDVLRKNIQQLRDEAEKKLSEEHSQQRLNQQRDLDRKIEEQNILREKENEALRQLQEEQRQRSSRGSSSEPDHVMELKERALKDYERRRALIDQEISRQQGQAKFHEQRRQRDMDDLKAKFDQQRPVSALKTTNGNKPKKQVSFSHMSTEFREPSSPTYVVESSSGYTAKITPAASVRLVQTRPPAEPDTPPDSPTYSPPDSPIVSPPIPRPPPPEYDEYDPPPLPPPPTSDELLGEDDFPPPPKSAFSDRSSSSSSMNSSGPRSPLDGNSRNYSDVFPADYPYPTSGSQSRNTIGSGYGTYPRAARPMSYPTPADLDSIQFSDSMKYSGSNNNIIGMNSLSGGIRETRSLGRINTSGENSAVEASRIKMARFSLKDESNNGPPPPIPKKPEHLAFKDKMKLFNQDTTPRKKDSVSKWQREHHDVNGDVTYT